MSRFQVFEAVELNEAIVLSDGGSASAGTPATIIEVFQDGDAYLVELFGNWVTADVHGDFTAVEWHVPGAFMETVGVETVTPPQLRLAQPGTNAFIVRTQLFSVIDHLSEDAVAEVKDFAEFLRQKHQKTVNVR